MLFFIVLSSPAGHGLAIRSSITIFIFLSVLDITSRVPLPLLFKKSRLSGRRGLWAHLIASSRGLL